MPLVNLHKFRNLQFLLKSQIPNRDELYIDLYVDNNKACWFKSVSNTADML